MGLIGLPFVYSYALKDLTNRSTTDLTHFKDTIEKSIEVSFPGRVINVSIYRNYFEFTLSTEASDGELRRMGKEIVQTEPRLNDIKKDYGYSTQLLRRISFDIVLKDKCSQTIAVVEIKGSYSEADVKKAFRNMVAHGLVPNLKYFLLITQHEGFLWRDTEIHESTEPALKISMNDIISRYVGRDGLGPLRHSAIEMIVIQWLNQLSENLVDQAEYSEAEQQLLQVGFIGAIRNCTLSSEVEL